VRGIRVLHVTDSHLFKSNDAQLMKESGHGAVTYDTAMAVMRHAMQVVPHPHTVVLGGDLSHDASPESYHHCIATFETFGRPLRYVAGNHDNAAILEQTFRQSSMFGRHDNQFVTGN